MDMPSVAFQGEVGSYSELAVLEHFGENITAIPCQSFEDVFAVSGMTRLDTARILAQMVDEGVISRG